MFPQISQRMAAENGKEVPLNASKLYRETSRNPQKMVKWDGLN